ncbi:MAG: (Fe-S)-binding protein [Chloroflexota bacterium]
MLPSREIYWNIQFSWIVYVLAVITLGIFIYALYRRYRFWRSAKPANRANHWGRRIWGFIVLGIFDGIFHRKIFGAATGTGDKGRLSSNWVPKEFYPGALHFLVFAGSIVFLVATFLDFISHYFFHFMTGNFYLGYSVVSDSFGILAIIGAVLLLVRRYAQKPARLDNKPDDLVVLLLFLAVVITGFVVEGVRMAANELEVHPDWAVWSPGGYILALALSGLSENTLLITHRSLWWFHSLLSLGAIAYVSLYYTKLFHIMWSPLNVFFRNLEPRGTIAAIDLEKAETFGASKIEDLNWKQQLDLEACVRCGRCQDACPAYASGKALNPKKLIQDLKTQLYEVRPMLPGSKPVEKRKDMISEAVTEEVIWDCTTCYACGEVCPIYVEHVDKIIEMRRSLAMERSQFPESVGEALKSLNARAHPWRGTTASRTDWANGLDVKVLADDNKVDVLFWVGCTGALEDRNMKVSVATAHIFQAAGINFGILGVEESCCGDPARRMGDEYLYQTLCQKNIEIMKGYGVKKIVTICPHCYNTLKNEYPQFGGNFEVVHHSQFIAGLIREGKIRPGGIDGNKAIAYHDSCYLGRYNNIYSAPREVLRAIGGIKHVELARSGARSFCCGGGGGHMWMDEEPAKRVNVRRTEDVIQAKADIIASACPYCLAMFEDGLKSKGVEETVKAMDLSELVYQSLAKEKPAG